MGVDELLRCAATESVIGMIDRQRQDQERMLKTLAMGEFAGSVSYG